MTGDGYCCVPHTFTTSYKIRDCNEQSQLLVDVTLNYKKYFKRGIDNNIIYIYYKITFNC